MNWTTPAGLRAQVQKLWERGVLLASLVDDNLDFPIRLVLKGPSSRELTEQFAEVRDWISQLRDAQHFYRIEWRQIRHRVLGTNLVPSAVWIDSLEDACALLGKRQATGSFKVMLAQTRERQPRLLSWLAKRPLRALSLAEDWTRVLSLVDWMQKNPRPDVYLREVALPGIHSKFIEEHRGVLTELLDLVLPDTAIDPVATGIGDFARRFGFRDKPLRLRFRVLDPGLRLLPCAKDQDVTLTRADFACLEPPVRRVFMTENEINFLTFPQVSEALVIFGAGYGFEALADADWLGRCAIHYWGDIDTHGFAILNQLRAVFPHTMSLLMDSDTLLNHRGLWAQEMVQQLRDLKYLTPAETALYDDLRHNRLGERVRLEQERVRFDLVGKRLEKLDTD